MISFKNKWLLAFAAAGLSFGAVSASEKNKEEKSKGYLEAQKGALFSKENISQRTKPVGKIYVEGDDVPAAAAPPAVASTGPRSGADVYASNCSACHAAGVGGAPKYGTAVWNDLAAKGIDNLLQSVLNGKGIMPAKGGCSNCSDDELQQAVEHMVASAK
ncbi:MAG: cytochrome c5 family protein [Gammaproteobacteria bacterium]|nr:cytochrome c5 family protein [Gammaproteobacteria bacterium]